jgi:rhomboid protease GluP
MSGEEEPEVVAVARRQRQADDWALVLHSQGLAAEVSRAREGWCLETAARDAARARELLAAWERENVREPEPEAPPLAPFPWLAMAALSGALIGFFAVTGPRAGASEWFGAGSARAARILAGEWWRGVTALTLHADAGHVLGNALGATLFAGTLWQRFGAGIGLALLVAAGTLGNFANAFWRGAGHSSVGASTAVFAAVGALAADALVQRRVPRGGRLAPLGAGLGILAMLGTSERADLSAHFFGLASGLLLGLPLAQRLPRPPGLAAQALAGLVAVALVAGAWWRALAP